MPNSADQAGLNSVWIKKLFNNFEKGLVESNGIVYLCVRFGRVVVNEREGRIVNEEIGSWQRGKRRKADEKKISFFLRISLVGRGNS